MYLSLFCFCILIQYSLALLQVASNPQSAIEHYLTSQQFISQNNKNCIIILNSNFSGAKDVLTQWHLRSKNAKRLPQMIIHTPAEEIPKNPQTIVNKPLEETSKYHTKLDHVIIFVEKLDDLDRVMEDVLQSDFLSFSVPKYHILVLEAREFRLDELKKASQSIWKTHYILSFVLVIVDHLNEMKIIEFCPFEKKFTVVSSVLDTTLYSDKVKDLKGSEIKVSLFPIASTNVNFTHNTCTDEKKCFIMTAFSKYINAKVNIVPVADLLSAMRSAINGTVDISFCEVWYQQHIAMYSTYPITVSRAVALVPKGKKSPTFLNLLLVFDPQIWLLIIFLKAFFFIVSILFKKLRPHWNFHVSFKCILLSAFVFTIIFENAFQGAVITAITSPHFEKDIDTVDDLIYSGLKLYSEEAWRIMISEKLSPHSMMYLEIGSTLRALRGTGAYIVAEWWADVFLVNKTPTGDQYDNYYHKVQEPLGFGRISYLLRKNSPFRKAFSEFVLLMNDFGLLAEFGKLQMSRQEKATTQKLNLNHMSSAFVPLICGLALSAAVFFVETIWNKLR